MKTEMKYYTRSNGKKILISEMSLPHLRNALNLVTNYLAFNARDIWDPEFPTDKHLEYKDLLDEINRRKKSARLALQELFRCNIAGVQYSDYQLAKLSIRPGARLQLWWESKNKMDQLAIRVELKGVKLGYIPQKHWLNKMWQDAPYQAQLHSLREQGVKIITTLVSYNPTNPTWSMFTIKCEAKQPVVKK